MKFALRVYEDSNLDSVWSESPPPPPQKKTLPFERIRVDKHAWAHVVGVT